MTMLLRDCAPGVRLLARGHGSFLPYTWIHRTLGAEIVNQSQVLQENRERSVRARRISFIAVSLAVLAAAHILSVSAQTVSTWAIGSGPIDRHRYFGELVANGMIGIVTSPNPFEISQILLNGAYEPVSAGEVDCLMRTLNFLNLHVSIDGQKIDQSSQIIGLHQTLDMKRAVFITTFDLEDKATITTSLRALRQLPYAAMLEVTVTAKRPIEVKGTSSIEGGFQQDESSTQDAHRPLSDLKFFEHKIQIGEKPEQSVLLSAASAFGDAHRVELAAAQTFLFDSIGVQPQQLQHLGSGMTFTQNVAAGTQLHFALIGATGSSANMADPVNEVQRITATAFVQGIPTLVGLHESAWAKLWQGDIAVEGDDLTERDIHSMLYHLYASIREGSGLSISPMGLSRDTTGYLGHVFWDAETWMFPSLLVLHPELAREMLEYRFARLSAARHTAFENGYEGAQFPWESAQSGEEDTPLCCMPLEIHVTADIGIAAWDYYSVTQDTEWLRTRGYPLLKATAEFWVSRVSRTKSGHFDIEHVVAADEYANDVANDAFTNAAARENLIDAVAAARILKIQPNPDWQLVHDRIPILKFPDGVTREFAAYNGGLIKQADVNLLAFPLHEISDPHFIGKDLEYYASRVDQTDGPAMTKSVLAILYERIGMPQKAFELFKSGYQPNQRPPFGVISETENSNNPYFMTGAGGLLQTILFGFDGLEITDRGLVQTHAQLPRGWKSLRLTGIGVLQKEYTIQ